MSLFFGDEPDDDEGILGERFENFGDPDLTGLDSEEKPIERVCRGCGKTYELSITAATEIAPDGQFDICNDCLSRLATEGRKLLEGGKPVYE